MASTEIAKRQQQPSEELAPLVGELERLRPHVRQLGVDEQRFMRIVFNELQRNPELGKCQPTSLYFAVLRSAEYGLDPALGLSWLIPRAGKVTWQIGYKGVIDLAARSGIIIQAGTVYPEDHFVQRAGTDAGIEHTPQLNPKGEPVAWYAVATLPDGRTMHRVLSKDEVEKRRKAGKTKLESGRPWFDWYDSMARKTAILALMNVIPLSGELRSALAADGHEQTIGVGGLEPVPEERALTAAGEEVDRKTGEIIETSSPPRGEGSGAQPSGPEHSAPEEGERSRVGVPAVVDVTPEPETSEPSPAHAASSTADAAHVTPVTAPPATPDQIDMLKAVASEYSWTDSDAFELLGISGWDDATFTFEDAKNQMTHWIGQLEKWRINRRSRLASAAHAHNVDLPKLLAERQLPPAGELDARTCQSLIDKLEAEQSPVSQPSTAAGGSAPAADSTSEELPEQDPELRAQFEASLTTLFAGPSARARWLDKHLLSLGLKSKDQMTDQQLRAAIDKCKKDTA